MLENVVPKLQQTIALILGMMTAVWWFQQIFYFYPPPKKIGEMMQFHQCFFKGVVQAPPPKIFCDVPPGNLVTSCGCPGRRCLS